MKLLLFRILFFGLIPSGAFVIYKTLRFLRKSFNGKVLIEIPFGQKCTVFEIQDQGVYAIWQKGPYLRELPSTRFRPVIYSETDGKRITLTPSVLRPNTTGGKTIKMELFRFSALPGKYRIELAEGSSVSKTERLLTSLIPLSRADSGQYWIQIRESQPLAKVLLGILLLVFSGIIIIGGFVLGILAGQFIAE